MSIFHKREPEMLMQLLRFPLFLSQLRLLPVPGIDPEITVPAHRPPFAF